MKIEHFALNVPDPLGMAEWYVRELGMSIVRQSKEAPFITFLGDSSGRVMLEIYSNPLDKVPDYPTTHPLRVHLAFISENPAIDRDRLIAAGATLFSDDVLPDGSHLVMLRDPWGVAVQLCKRAKPMLKG